MGGVLRKPIFGAIPPTVGGFALVGLHVLQNFVWTLCPTRQETFTDNVYESRDKHKLHLKFKKIEWKWQVAFFFNVASAMQYRNFLNRILTSKMYRNFQ